MKVDYLKKNLNNIYIYFKKSKFQKEIFCIFICISILLIIKIVSFEKTPKC